MRIPTTLEDWTLDAIRELVVGGLAESDHFDFKESIDTKGQGRGLRTAVCSFANSRGGFILFGISELGAGEERVVGIPYTRETAREIQQKLQRIDPSVGVSFQDPPIRLDDGRAVLVMEIPRSFRGPHWDIDEKKFWRRGHGTKVEMTHEEVRMAFVDHAERVGRLRLVFLSLIDNWVRLEDIVKPESGEGPLPNTVLDLSLLKANLDVLQLMTPRLVEPMLAILRVCDAISSRCSQMMMVSPEHIEVRRKVSNHHKYEIHSTMERLSHQFEFVLGELQKGYGFESISPRGVQGQSIPPVPQHWARVTAGY